MGIVRARGALLSHFRAGGVPRWYGEGTASPVIKFQGKESTLMVE